MKGVDVGDEGEGGDFDRLRRGERERAIWWEGE